MARVPSESKAYANADFDRGGGKKDDEEDLDLPMADSFTHFPEHAHLFQPPRPFDAKLQKEFARALPEKCSTMAEAKRVVEKANELFRKEPAFGTSTRRGEFCWLCDYAPALGDKDGMRKRDVVLAMINDSTERSLDALVNGIFEWYTNGIGKINNKPWNPWTIREHILLHAPVRKQVLLDDFRTAHYYKMAFLSKAKNRNGPPDIKASKEAREWARHGQMILRELDGMSRDRGS